jgi:hypothetical protein
MRHFQGVLESEDKDLLKRDFHCHIAACVLAFGLIGPKASLYANSPRPNVLWHIGGQGLFDATNKAYTIEADSVTVNLGSSDTLCPTGLGHLASGRTSVKQIVFQFEAANAGRFWLHVSWNPGGSGNEQFEVYCNDKSLGKSSLVDGQEMPYQEIDEKFGVNLDKGPNIIKMKHLSGDGLRFRDILLSCSEDQSDLPSPLNPSLKYPTLKVYESAIKTRAIMLDSDYVRLFAPKMREKEASTIFEYLVRAYDQLYKLVGIHTQYKIVVYHFPEGHPDAKGGTSNCTIWYSYKNLDFQADNEWKRYQVPHLSGYIEEMAHNFVSSSGAQFGWEMIGWSLGIKVTQQIADNPILHRNVANTRKTQKETFDRYIALGHRFPRDIAPNLCDRIHAYLLFVCEREYGPNFWEDFFREINKEKSNLLAAAKLSDSDQIRNRRYQITVDCFNRLAGLNFRSKLSELQISLTTDIKSLYPEKPGWNHRFID